MHSLLLLLGFIFSSYTAVGKNTTYMIGYEVVSYITDCCVESSVF